jgi:dolichol-phosphate mannosyltransferase
MPQPRFSFVIPLYNEAEVFSLLIDRMDQLLVKIEGHCEVILIDDGSTDNTPALMQMVALAGSNYQCIFLSRNFGHQKALSAGLKFARGEYIMVLDADLQDPPELFFEFYKKISEGFDVVYGIRTNRKESLLKRFAYTAFYNILNSISNYPIPKDTGDFAMISRKVAKAMTVMQEESRFLRGLRSWVGFKQIGIPYDRSTRVAGKTKYTFQKLAQLAYDGVFNFSVFPIKLLTYSGVICIGFAAIYFILTLLRKFLYNDVPLGFTALLFVIILFGGIQLISIGIVGEYVQRIFFQVKERPLFIISKRIVDGAEVYEQ